MTQRARRLYQLAAIFMVLTSLLWLLHLGFIWLWLQLTPLAIMAANAVLAPLQKRINNGYIDDARDRLAAYEGRIIGITGSFGKTTTKHILGHALEGLDHVFYSPGSINTVLGHTLQIRKHLSPQHGYFIAEMGAYGKGSIQRLCDFIPPQIAMVTAVGAAHYERFKTLETVAEAKSELPQAALQHAQGRAYLHDSVMVYAPFQDLKASAPTRVIVCGPEADSDVRLLETTTSLQGTEIQVSYKGLTEHYRLPILGQHNVGNLLLVVAFLRDEGFSEEEINIALRSMPQISHRLEQRETGSYTLLDDAYNSNPSGFRSALGVLNDLGQEKGGRRILITPGMVELGAQHAEAHAEIGALLGQTCDVLLAVRPDRIPTLVSKAKEGGVEVHAMPSFAAARAWLEQNAQPQDVVLIENDLPDLLEARRLL